MGSKMDAFLAEWVQRWMHLGGVGAHREGLDVGLLKRGSHKSAGGGLALSVGLTAVNAVKTEHSESRLELEIGMPDCHAENHRQGCGKNGTFRILSGIGNWKALFLVFVESWL